jgi:hypothetical protein
MEQPAPHPVQESYSLVFGKDSTHLTGQHILWRFNRWLFREDQLASAPFPLFSQILLVDKGAREPISTQYYNPLDLSCGNCVSQAIQGRPIYLGATDPIIHEFSI